MTDTKRIIIGISGASGAIYGVRLLQILKPLAVETHLVLSRAARMTLAQETDFTIADLHALADAHYPCEDMGAAISSGSFKTIGMIVAPCSVRSLSEIASGVTSTLLTRAADVALKERRRLVLMLRETPLHAGHIQSMLRATEAGAIIAPPVPAFYNRPQTIDQMVDHTLGRILDLFDIDSGLVERWSGLGPKPA